MNPQKINDFSEALAYMESLKGLGSKPGLDRIRSLLACLGHPEKRTPVIQIAGTNGKGSVGAFLSAMLTAAGWKTGHFSSPAVFSPTETIRINGASVSEELYARGVSAVAEAAGQMENREGDSRSRKTGQDRPTVFETETALAWWIFAGEKCDIAVVECGMGGREDATNVTASNVCSVITPIAVDHTAFLGDTLEEIAAHKAGIIKSGCPVASALQQPAAEAVLRTRAETLGSRFYVAETPLAPEQLSGGYMTGEYQRENGALAVLAANLASQRGFAVSDDAIRQGLLSARWPGRYEKCTVRAGSYAGNCTVILDGAHNPHGAGALLDNLRKDYAGCSLVGIAGVFADKDRKEMCRILAPAFRKVYTVTPPGPRGLDGRVLAEEMGRYTSAVPCGSVREGYEKALAAAAGAGEDRTVIVAWGSLSWMAALRDMIDGKGTE